MLGVSVTYQASRRTYGALAALVGASRTSRLVVLTYHAVRESDVRNFEIQMRDLERRATAVFADGRLISNGRQAIAVTFDDAFQSVVDNALPVLAKYGIPATVFVPTGFLGGAPGWILKARSHGASDNVISADTLKALDSRRVRIGSHTVTHPRLAALESARLRTELAASKQMLETLTAGPVRMLAFPYGSFNARVVAAAEQAGYERVFANVPVATGKGSPTLMGRVDVSPHDWPIEFRLKSQGAYEWMAVAISVKRTMLRFFGRPHAS